METTFKKALVGDRVYSPIFASKKPSDKTNATIIKITHTEEYQILVRPDIAAVGQATNTFNTEGHFVLNGGQALFWENPIREIPTRPRRIIQQKGFIAVYTKTISYYGHVLATSNLFQSFELAEREAIATGRVYVIKEIEYKVEE